MKESKNRYLYVAHFMLLYMTAASRMCPICSHNDLLQTHLPWL